MNTQLLKRFWQQVLHGNSSFAGPAAWDEQVGCIHQCGKGLEETLRYLYSDRPAFETFLEWMVPANPIPTVLAAQEDVLTVAELDFFAEHGYVVLHQLVTQQQAADARHAILEFLHADLDKPTTWYTSHEEMRGLMLMFYHHPALQVVRDSPRLRRAYEQLYGTKNIHNVIDKVSFNPPETPFYTFRGSPLHWDVSLVPPIPFVLQGLLYLSDVTADGGAFKCVPGFHNRLQGWLASLPPGVNPREVALLTLTPVAIAGVAGDFIIWHQGLPHCASANHANTPRIVQYHTWLPDCVAEQTTWI